MRLLRRDNHGRLTFCTANEEHIDKPYAILSHTWGRDEEEVTYQDIVAGTVEDKVGFRKLNFILDQAGFDDLHYVWVDTCCINKHNFTELNKAINLMYDWYANSSVCYVYLSDVGTHIPGSPTQPVSFQQSKWHTRGWTLQELVAPKKLEFYDRDGHYLGSRASLAESIYRTTGVPVPVLCKPSLQEISLLDRFRWSMTRQTKEPEDKSYCMLGILGVKVSSFSYGIGSERAQKLLFDEVKDKYGNTVYVELQRCTLRSADLQPPAMSHEQSAYSSGALRKSLAFSEMSSRREAIDQPQFSTCDWLMNHHAYQQWSDINNNNSAYAGFLWIKGHPGAGKSTLIKYADLKTEDLMTPNTIQISFYFNARGSRLQKSIVGMYRALLFQLLDRLPLLEEPLCVQMRLQQLISSGHTDWTKDQLKDMFRFLITRLGAYRLRCFVDALDECDTADIQDVIRSFRNLTRTHPVSGQRFFVCLASRYYPALTVKDHIEIRLDQEQQHLTDLERYVHDELDLDDDQSGRKIKHQIVSRANGVFMWAFLVVRLLNQELANGTIDTIQDTIKRLPRELDGIYREIIDREHGDNLKRFQLCVQLVLFSRRPLTGVEFYHAIPQGSFEIPVSPSVTFKPGGQTPTHKVIEKFVASSSRGVAALEKGSNKSTVQFIHESVRDFFFVHQGLQYMFPQVLVSLVPWCHDCLKILCERYHSSAVSLLSQADSSPSPLSFLLSPLEWCEAHQVPYLLYAAGELLFHAERAATCISQEFFVANSDWSLVIETWRSLGLMRVSLPSGSELLEALIEHDYVQLMSLAIRLAPYASINKEELLFRAMSYGAVAVLHQLLIYGAGVKVSTFYNATCIGHAIDTMREPLYSHDEQFLWRPPEARFSAQYSREINSETVVMLAWSGTGTDVVRMILYYGAAVDQRGDDGTTALMTAVWHQDIPSMKLLLQHGASVNLAKEDGTTGLMIAVLKRSSDMIEVLVEYGAVLDLKDNDGRTALMIACACEYSNSDAIRLLLGYGASADLCDNIGRTAIYYTFLSSTFENFKTLNEHGPSFDVIDLQGRTTMLLLTDVQRRGGGDHADYNQCYCGRVSMLQVLLDQGVDPRTQDNFGRVAWSTQLIQVNSCGRKMAGLISAATARLECQVK